MELADVAHFHDWYLTGFDVDCEARRLVLHLGWYPGTPAERRLDVVFEEVVGHMIENVLSGNIVSSLDELTPRLTVEAAASFFEQRRDYAFPDVREAWKTTAELITLLEEQSVRSFEFSSSYGAHGFVLARGMSIVPAQT